MLRAIRCNSNGISSAEKTVTISPIVQYLFLCSLPARKCVDFLVLFMHMKGTSGRFDSVCFGGRIVHSKWNQFYFMCCAYHQASINEIIELNFAQRHKQMQNRKAQNGAYWTRSVCSSFVVYKQWRNEFYRKHLPINSARRLPIVFAQERERKHDKKWCLKHKMRIHRWIRA